MSDDAARAAKAHLHQCLRWARAEVLPKLDGLDEYDVRRPMTRTGTNLLGLVKHLAFYEATYFGFVFDRPYPEPLPTVDQGFRNEDLMWVPADESREQVVDDYRRACRHADDTIEALPIDAVGHVPWWGAADVPLFSVLAHMVGETRQHLGHLDIIREQLDGRIGEDVEALSPEQEADFARRWRRTERAARVAGHRFTPAGFTPPTSLVDERFRLEPLGPQHNTADHAAWTSSIEHIRASPGYPDGDWPPDGGLTLEENLADLERHARDFETGRGFTFTVLEPADGDVIGCVYLYPSAAEHDVVVQSWVRADRAHLDTPLADAVARWFDSDWPWSRPDRCGR
ncbi:DinB family protein [Intrasporangium calvum]|uniref:DinB family protein n=1 Tax=Intrasporangium calvum TaxID=53358 RepID=UPI001F39E2E3|nr:DinB family protein [Intrasporangium calvum]